MGLDNSLYILDLENNFIISVKEKNYKLILNNIQKAEVYNLIDILNNKDDTLILESLSKFQNDMYNFFVNKEIYVKENSNSEEIKIQKIVGPEIFINKFYENYLSHMPNWRKINNCLENRGNKEYESAISVYINNEYILVSNGNLNINNFVDSTKEKFINEYAAAVVYNSIKNNNLMNYISSYLIKIDLKDFDNKQELLEFENISYFNFENSFLDLEIFSGYYFELNYQDYYPFISIEINNQQKIREAIILGFDKNDVLNNTIKFINDNQLIKGEFENVLNIKEYIPEIYKNGDEIMNSFFGKLIPVYFPKMKSCIFNNLKVRIISKDEEEYECSLSEVTFNLSKYL
ncbi:hypothetical protein [Viridibacillus arvi]|uniref:Uncharacterized protein n=1 Tax=Viridibacillus arvi TaxID=263475 RepID=A0A0M0LLB9_9BACL|nr:hypothetical protein [Viridibacillus arvi]KOO51839.1 hypothetical protein AMD00_05230 [Viridibacillus arvi]